jgi:hypothetical protein
VPEYIAYTKNRFGMFGQRARTLKVAVEICPSDIFS